MLTESDLNKIGDAIIGSAFDIRNAYGRLMAEGFYEQVMEIELRGKGLRVDRQRYIDINHKGVIIHNAYRLDTVVNDSVIIEYKALPKMGGEEFRQIMTYLRLTGLNLGYLINFGAHDFSFGRMNVKDNTLSKGLYRIVNNI